MAPPSGRPQGLEEMDVNTLFSMTLPDRLAWYRRMLQPFEPQVQASARANIVPPQLVATVILNELADINWQDVWQQRLGMNGSLGIAQIQVDTALAHGLTTQPGDAQRIQQSAQQAHTMCLIMSRGGYCPSPQTYADWTRRELTRVRLTIPQFAVEAAAREVRRILDRMTQRLTNPWQQRFRFTLTSVAGLAQPNDVYNHIDGADRKAKELNLAEMVVAAYNSPGIMDAQQQASITPGAAGFIYNNGTIHGSNARLIAEELHDQNLFH
jgi:hypothetical protein